MLLIYLLLAQWSGCQETSESSKDMWHVLWYLNSPGQTEIQSMICFLVTLYTPVTKSGLIPSDPCLPVIEWHMFSYPHRIHQNRSSVTYRNSFWEEKRIQATRMDICLCDTSSAS
jgi:hypothetical protein